MDDMTVKPLAEGRRSDFYLLANARRIASRTYQRKPNWALAMELFATGSTMAWRICVDAGIDPESRKVERIKEAPHG